MLKIITSIDDYKNAIKQVRSSHISKSFDAKIGFLGFTGLCKLLCNLVWTMPKGWTNAWKIVKRVQGQSPVPQGNINVFQWVIDYEPENLLVKENKKL